MAVCYNKLWKILIDRGMSKTELIKSAKISTNAMAKLVVLCQDLVQVKMRFSSS